MELIVVGDVNNDLLLQKVCKYLADKNISFQIESSLSLAYSKLADAYIIAYYAYTYQPSFHSTLPVFILSVPSNQNAFDLPANAQFVCTNAFDSELFFRLTAFLDQLEENASSQNILLDTIFCNASDLVILVDEEGVIERVNRPNADMNRKNVDMFVTRGKLINCINSFNANGCGYGRNCQTCQVRSATQKAFDNKQDIDKEICTVLVKNASGENIRKQVELTVKYFNYNGSPKALMIVHDFDNNKIHDLVAGEPEKIDQRLIGAAAEIGKIAFWELDTCTFVSRGNQVWKEWLQTDKETQALVDWSQHIEPRQYKDFISKLVQVVRGEEYAFDAVFSFNYSAEHNCWIQTKCFGSDYQADGKPLKLICVSQDITEIVEKEFALRQQKANQHALLENTSDAVWLLSPDYRIVEMNAVFRKTFNMFFKKKFVEHDDFLSYLPESIADRWLRFFERVKHGESVGAMENISFQKLDRFFELRFAPVWMDDDVVAISCYMSEVTLQKRYESMLKYARKNAETANRAKSQFLANMSHEIRTPLNAILGFSEILEATENKEDNLSYLRSIKNSGKTLLKVINDVLDLSKIEAGKLDFSPEYTDVYHLLTETFEPFIFRAQQKRLSFKSTITDTKGVYLYIDNFRFRQIVLNLLSNALKFTEKGSIHCNVSLDKRKKHEAELLLQVSDTGIGIGEDGLNEIFDPFNQQDNQDTRKYSGTGLGLSITKQLVDLMHGTIRVESKADTGSLFTVSIPNVGIKKADVPISEKLKVKEKRFDLSSKTALVVDDIAEHRQVIGGYLKFYNINTVFAQNGKEALALMQNIHPDIVFMDMRMPVMDGYKATKLIRSNGIAGLVPIVAVTAEAYTNEIDELIENGFAALLHKPVQLNELHQTLASVFKLEEAIKSSNGAKMLEGVTIEVKRDLQCMALKLRVKQPRMELMSLSTRMIEAGTNYNAKLLIQFGEELKYATEHFQIIRIREIIAELSSDNV